MDVCDWRDFVESRFFMGMPIPSAAFSSSTRGNAGCLGVPADSDAGNKTIYLYSLKRCNRSIIYHSFRV